MHNKGLGSHTLIIELSRRNETNPLCMCPLAVHASKLSDVDTLYMYDLTSQSLPLSPSISVGRCSQVKDSFVSRLYILLVCLIV